MEISERLWEESMRSIDARFARAERDIDELYSRQCEIEKLDQIENVCTMKDSGE